MFRQTKEPVYCPVGDEKLGERWMQEGYAAYCNDCNHTYYFKAREMRPHRSIKGTIRDHVCGCGCGR